MILDKANLFSDAQAVTATAFSTVAIDLGAPGRGTGEPVEVFCQVVADFSGGDDLTVSLETAADAAFTTPATLVSSGAALTAALKAGYRFGLGSLPEGAKRYVRLKYAVTGLMGTGKITAGLVYDRQTNN